MRSYVVVNDGVDCWTADKTELFEALIEAGWEPVRQFWREPLTEGAYAYTDLCQAIPDRSRECAPSVELAWFIWRPDQGVWEFVSKEQ